MREHQAHVRTGLEIETDVVTGRAEDDGCNARAAERLADELPRRERGQVGVGRRQRADDQQRAQVAALDHPEHVLVEIEGSGHDEVEGRSGHARRGREGRPGPLRRVANPRRRSRPTGPYRCPGSRRSSGEVAPAGKTSPFTGSVTEGSGGRPVSASSLAKLEGRYAFGHAADEVPAVERERAPAGRCGRRAVTLAADRVGPVLRVQPDDAVERGGRVVDGGGPADVRTAVELRVDLEAVSGLGDLVEVPVAGDLDLLQDLVAQIDRLAHCPEPGHVARRVPVRVLTARASDDAVGAERATPRRRARPLGLHQAVDAAWAHHVALFVGLGDAVAAGRDHHLVGQDEVVLARRERERGEDADDSGAATRRRGHTSTRHPRISPSRSALERQTEPISRRRRPAPRRGRRPRTSRWPTSGNRRTPGAPPPVRSFAQKVPPAYVAQPFGSQPSTVFVHVVKASSDVWSVTGQFAPHSACSHWRSSQKVAAQAELQGSRSCTHPPRLISARPLAVFRTGPHCGHRRIARWS